jgi:hypothetical protein
MVLVSSLWTITVFTRRARITSSSIIYLSIMTVADSHEVIAETVLAVRSGERPERHVTVSFGRPRLNAEGDWSCEHRLAGLEGVDDRPVTAFGLDSLQALCLSIEMVRMRLLAIERQLAVRLLGWDGVSVALPVLKTRHPMPIEETGKSDSYT